MVHLEYKQNNIGTVWLEKLVWAKPEEDERMLKLLQLHGRDFKEISKALNRGLTQLQNHCKKGAFGKLVAAKFPAPKRKRI